MEEKKPVGAIISIIVIVFVLVFGAYYFLKQVPGPEGLGGTLTSEEVQADATISTLSKQSTSTNIADIQKDIDDTDLSNIGTGLSDIAI